MTLSAGTRLGPYEILAPIGAGGMGEVYRARDMRLTREVAVKVLPAGLSSDPERLKRFEKEARSASSLNHPNIVTVYDIGQAGGTSFIAMELVGGQTLREMLAEGALPTKRLLTVAAQIADGLAKAHSAGIVHRDLKPDNVMVTKDGFVKILDFGLAKLTQPEGASGATQGPTVSAGTEPGIVMGTVGYMSPEQTLGRVLDFRSDQFSFGSILYEMATSKRAFARGNAPETMAAIIREEPEPIVILAPQAPPPLRWIVERCLAKDPEDRYAATKDLARDLAGIRDHLSEASVSGAMPAAEGQRRRLLRGVLPLALALLASWAGVFLLGRSTQASKPPTFQRLTFRRGTVQNARFAPDGQTVIYSANWDGRPREVFLTRPGSPESRSFGLKSVDIYGISSSGEMAINIRGGTLARMPMDGGAPRDVLENVWGADWAPDGHQLAIVTGRGGERGRLEFPIGRLLYESTSIINPRVSPDGRFVAFVEHNNSLGVADPQGKIRTLLKSAEGIDRLAWSPGASEVWFTGPNWRGTAQKLRAVSLAGRVRDVATFPVPIALGDVSREGRVLFAAGASRSLISGKLAGATEERDLSWFDHSWAPKLSADGRVLVFTESGGAASSDALYMRRAGDAEATRLSEGFASALSHDGKWVLAEMPGPKLTLVPTGAGEPRSLVVGLLEGVVQAGFFPDGRRIAISGNEKGHPRRTWLLDIPEGKPRPLTPEKLAGAAVSPDGKWILVSDIDTQKRFLFPAEGGEPRPVPGLTEDDAPEIQWGPDSQTLFVHVHGETSTQVFRLDLQTGRRELWLTLTPPDPAGIGRQEIEPALSADGKSYVSWYYRWVNDLYLAEGLK